MFTYRSDVPRRTCLPFYVRPNRPPRFTLEQLPLLLLPDRLSRLWPRSLNSAAHPRSGRQIRAFHERRQPPPLLERRVGASTVEALIAGHQLGAVRSQPLEPELANIATQVQ